MFLLNVLVAGKARKRQRPGKPVSYLKCVRAVPDKLSAEVTSPSLVHSTGQRGAGGGLSNAACLPVDLYRKTGEAKSLSVNEHVRCHI